MGTNSKRSGKNTPKFQLIPAYTKTHIYVEKINSITRSISKSISLIYFSIKITIKEWLAKNGGHLSSENTIMLKHLNLHTWNNINKTSATSKQYSEVHNLRSPQLRSSTIIWLATALHFPRPSCQCGGVESAVLPVQFSRMPGKDICLTILKISQLVNFCLGKKTQ